LGRERGVGGGEKQFIYNMKIFTAKGDKLLDFQKTTAGNELAQGRSPRKKKKRSQTGKRGGKRKQKCVAIGAQSSSRKSKEWTELPQIGSRIPRQLSIEGSHHAGGKEGDA